MGQFGHAETSRHCPANPLVRHEPALAQQSSAALTEICPSGPGSPCRLASRDDEARCDYRVLGQPKKSAPSKLTHYQAAGRLARDAR